MNTRNLSFRLITGVTLIVLGVLFLVGQVINPRIWHSIWPIIIIAFGMLFFGGMSYWGKNYGFLAIPGSIITGTGLVLLLQNFTSQWYTWSYSWVLYVAFVGFGLWVYGKWSEIPNLKVVGEKMTMGGIIGFILLGALFEMTIFSNVHSVFKGVFWAVLIIGLGIYMILRTTVLPKRNADVVDTIFSSNEIPSTQGQQPNVKSAAPSELQLEGVDSINFMAFGNLEIGQGEKPELRIEASSEFLSHLITEVNGNVLTIRLDNDWLAWTGLSFMHPEQVYFYLTLKQVHGIRHTGAGRVRFTGIQTDAIKVTHEGAGEMIGTQLQAKNLTVDLRGVGRLALDGKVTAQDARLGGAGSYEADALECQKADITLSGVGSAKVWVTNELNAQVTGAGSIHYRGEPQLTQHVTGIGSIQHI
jgi:hypothetical protein